MNLLIADCHVLRAVKLPQRGRYPEIHIASLFQERTGDMFNVVCDEECFADLQATDRDAAVTVEASAHQIATQKGKAWKLRAVAVFAARGGPPLRSQAAAEDKQAAGLRVGAENGGLTYKPTRRPR